MKPSVGVRVLSWSPRPPDHLPDPVLQDDSESFPAEVVKDVREWLKSTQEEFQTKPPTPVTICKGGLMVGDKKNPFVKHEAYLFDHYTVELLLKTKDKTIAVKYRYLGARERKSGKMIVGPKLREINESRIDSISV